MKPDIIKATKKYIAENLDIYECAFNKALKAKNQKNITINSVIIGAYNDVLDAIERFEEEAEEYKHICQICGSCTTSHYFD